MPTKAWYLSKTIWSDIVTAIVGVWGSLIAYGVHIPAIPSWVLVVLGGLGIYGRATATTTITS